jgi:hypothetical protein
VTPDALFASSRWVTGAGDGAVTTKGSDDTSLSGRIGGSGRRVVLLVLLPGIVLIVVGFWATGAGDPDIRACFGPLPFAASPERVTELLGAGGTCSKLDLRTSLVQDSLAALLYGCGLAGVCFGGTLLFGGFARRACGFGAVAGLMAASADLAENAILLLWIDQDVIADAPAWTFAASAGAGLLKWSALLVAAVVAFIVTATTAGRGVVIAFDRWADHRNSTCPAPTSGTTTEPADRGVEQQLADSLARDRRPERALKLAPLENTTGTTGTTDDHDGPGAVWRLNYQIPEGHGGDTGLCLSGGGIRSATFALGATQQLESADRMDQLDLVAAVSGGAYHATSRQLLLNRPPTGKDGVPQPITDPYAPGTPEEHHRRRHGRYLAEGGGGWVAAIGIVLRNLALSAAIVTSLLLVLARAHATMLRLLAPWTERILLCDSSTVTGDNDSLVGLALTVTRSIGRASVFASSIAIGGNGADAPTERTICEALDGFALPVVAVLVLTPLALAALVWLLGGFVATRPRDQAPYGAKTPAAVMLGHSDTFATGILAVGAVGALVFVIGPALVVLSGWLGTQGQTWTPTGRQAAGGTVGLVVSLLWSMLGKKRDGAAAAGASTVRKGLATAGFVTRFLLSAAVVLGIIVALTLAYAGLLRAATEDLLLDARSPLTDPWLLGALGLLLVLYFFLDQTRMSLHPFYKRRLAAALAVERTGDGGAGEIDYAIATPLSRFARPVPAASSQHPGARLLICAAAHVSGPELAPPGRRVTPFVFASDAIGGPRLGYVHTAELEKRVAGLPYSHDLTTVGAMALSGAAFASAMGRMSGPYNALFALTNARLGAWLPNPRYHDRLGRCDQARPTDDSAASASPVTPAVLDRHRRYFPRVRRLPYWLREIVGRYDPDHRLVYVSDGGHYENLGLLELLRRGCLEIWCIDASGDASLGSLVEAIRVAEEELGVRIVFDEGLDPLLPIGMGKEAAAAGHAGPPELLRRLEGRLSSSCVGLATIQYPTVGPKPGMAGRLNYGRAGLTPETPEHILHYATTAPEFPNDSTGDQWFDVTRFEAYRGLGGWVAEQLVAAVQADVR